MRAPAYGLPYDQALDRLRIANGDPQAAIRRQRLIIAGQLREARKRIGIGQIELAQRINVKPADISRWENAHGAPSALHLEWLSDVLDEPLSYFYGGPSSHG